MFSDAAFQKSKQFIYRHGRLIDRKRFAYHFESGEASDVMAALACYQNEDGGFGHGLEMDLMCPESTVAATEIACLLLEEFGVQEGEMVEGIERWCLSSVDGFPQPPSELTAYPHGPWWADPEGHTLHFLTIAGFLAKWGKGTSELFRKAETLFQSHPVPKIEIYHYTYYHYLRFLPREEAHEQAFQEVCAQLPALLETAAGYHPLFFYLWWMAAEEFSPEVIRREAEKLLQDFQEDGGLRTPYPQLPWWRPVWTLEALIHLKRHRLLTGSTQKDPT